jgi:hypothetical protein
LSEQEHNLWKVPKLKHKDGDECRRYHKHLERKIQNQRAEILRLKVRALQAERDERVFIERCRYRGIRIDELEHALRGIGYVLAASDETPDVTKVDLIRRLVQQAMGKTVEELRKEQKGTE